MRDKSERKETRARKLLPVQGASDMADRKLRFDGRLSNIVNHLTRCSRMSQDRWKPGSGHIPLWAGGPETPKPPAPRTLHPAAPARRLREKQPASAAVTGAKYRSPRRSRKHCPGVTRPRPSIVPPL